MPASSANISKSVARTFALLELFAEQRRPLSATEIRRHLELPQPSCRALLLELTSLGYLAQDPERHKYLPTAGVAALGDWIAESQSPDPRLPASVARLARQANETCSLSRRRGQRLEILLASSAEHPLALRLQPGLGEALWRSAAGRCLLANLPQVELAGLLEEFLRNCRRPRDRETLRGLPSQLAQIRRSGHYVAADVLLRGVTTVCLPLRASGQDFVITLAGASDRLTGREAQLLRLLRRELRPLLTR